MNFISKAFTRFYEWLYHPSFRWHKTSKAFIARYPSPGSQPLEAQLHNYKKPYTHSFYNVRFRKPTIHQAIPFSSQFAMDAFQAPTIPEKLIQAGLLKKQDENNKQAIESAKTQWFKKYRTPVEQRVARNDFGWKMPDPNNPETFRYLHDMRTKVNQYEEKLLRGDDNLDRIHNFRVPSMDWMCYYAGDPQFQQMLIEVFYKVEGIENQNINKGSIPLFSTNKNFWKALDSINDPENVLRVESHIGDPAPLDFSLKDPKGRKSVKVIKDGEGDIKLQAP